VRYNQIGWIIIILQVDNEDPNTEIEMITCPSCHTSNVDNTLFCIECGAYLANEDGQLTDSVGINLADMTPELGETDENASQSIYGTGPLAINLEIGDSKRQLQLPLNKPIHMGRLDPGASIFPEVDLTNDAGVERGVSRRHARIMKREQRIYVEDLGSSNGTFINGQKLMPYFPEVLSDGDCLRLGKLEIKVLLSHST
jgi:hypothetical protein